MKLLDTITNDSRSLLFEMLSILDFDAEVRHNSGQQPAYPEGEHHKVTQIDGDNLRHLIDVVLEELNEDIEVLTRDQPAKGQRFDAIKLTHLLRNDEELKEHYLTSLLGILRKHTQELYRNGKMDAWTLMDHLKNSIDH